MSVHPLLATLVVWERRYRRLRALQAAPYALLGLLLTLASGLVLGLSTGALVGACAVNVLAWGMWWHARVLRPLSAAARHWDTAWGLQERISTALELLNGRISAPPLLAERQLADALRAAQAVDASARLRVQWRAREGALVLIGALCLLLAHAWATRPPAPRAPLPQAAVAQARDALADALTELANDTQLDADTRSSALETLQARLNSLSDDALDLESAFALSSTAAQELRQLSERAQQVQASGAQPLAERILETLRRSEEALAAAAQTFQQADNAQRGDFAVATAMLPSGAAASEAGDTGSANAGNNPPQGQASDSAPNSEDSQVGEGTQGGGQPQEGAEAGGSQASVGQNDGAPQAGNGAGDAPAPPDALVSGEDSAPESERGGAGSAQSTTNPDGEGEGAADLLFLPLELPEVGEVRGEELRLAGELGDTPSALAPLELPAQGARAPYEQAFERYAAAAASALENPALPQGLRALIRAYFERLRP